MVNPNNDKQVKRLREAAIWSRRQLEPFRQNRLHVLRQYVGKNYSDDGARRPVPFNLLELAMNVYSRHLVANNPKTLVSTQVKELKPQAAELAVALDHLYDEIELAGSLQMVVLDALVSIGIMKIGVTSQGLDEVQGYLHDGGQPFADPVHLDDWVHDMGRHRLEQAAFMGNRYRMPFEVFQEQEQFKNKGDIKATEWRADYNEEGDERASVLTSGAQNSRGERDVEPMIELWDYWLPREGLLLTFPAEDEVLKPVRIVEWEGPEIGPYQILSFNPVPNNTMPLPPAALWMDMHDLSNVLFRKLGRQAERQKDITAYRGSSEEDARRVTEASDGETIRMDDPAGVQQFKSGGIDQTNLAFLLQLRDFFSYFGGNIDALGGLGAGHDTLGGEELLTASASKRVNDMQEKTANFVQNVTRSLAYYFWTDPLVHKELERSIAPNFSIPFVFSADKKEGDFLDYNIEIEPYSLQPQTPGRKLLAVRETFNQFIVPMLDKMEAQGMTVNMGQLLDLVAELGNVPEISELLMFMDGTPADEGDPKVTQDNTRQPNTRHESVRINKPGSTRQGKDKVMSSFLLGKDSQPDEKAAIGRPTS